MRLPQVGVDRRGSEATEPGGVRVSGTFCIWILKEISNLVHTVGEFVGLMSIQK